ncbi:MAG: hypothetical protein KDA44_14125 [Planctomycetales bacterium]|nr:hypothetical protein [Planctomycetales bacterium]
MLSSGYWFDGVDTVVLVLFIALAFGLPLLGYVFLALDIRRYLRSLRRALVLVSRVPTKTHYWALKHRPPCLKALGLDDRSTEEDVMVAYRERVKEFHPDRGGDLQKFLQLQKHFEQALHLVRQRAARGD